jgi:meiosis-specific APC/C activator protein AMA1
MNFLKESNKKHKKKEKKSRSEPISSRSLVSPKRHSFQPETILPNNNSTYGSVIDRFLPIPNFLPEKKIFNHQINVDSNPKECSRNIIVITNNRLDINTQVESFNTVNNINQAVANTNDIEVNSPVFNVEFPNLSNVKQKNLTHQESVASALGFKTHRILNFKPMKSPKKLKSLHDEIETINNEVPLNVKQEGFSFNGDSQPLKISNELHEIPFKVLDAPGLRNDYYSNLVCWANKSDLIAAGLGSLVYSWNEKNGTIPLEAFGTDVISALSYSSEDFLAVGTKESNIYVYGPYSTSIIANIEAKTNSSICSIKWIPKSNYFFIGNEIGDVSLYKLSETKTKQDSQSKGAKILYTLKLKITFKCDQQQICGIDVNAQSKQLAIGANNNNGSIWDISDLLKPKKMFHLKHDAAVKAVAFCPWMPNLLATGGGSRDKNIRFWHSKSGTLISEHKTKGQITAVVWSKSKKELLATFGFGDSISKNEILAVYSYPSMKIKITVNASYDMRILTADISNDFNSVCTSMSDQSVRIYNVWDSKVDFKSGIYDTGIYGSDIIDTEEGVDKAIDTIR